MKKIFTFLFCASIISSSFAQANKTDQYQLNRKSQYYSNLNIADKKISIIRERNAEIQEVNDDNNYHVQEVLNNDDFDIWQKRDILDNLESQRIRDVNNIYQKYSDEITYYSSKEKTYSYKTHKYYDDYNR